MYVRLEKHGTWLMLDESRCLVVCSRCIELFHGYNKKYLAFAAEDAPSVCPRCGAIMDGKQDVYRAVLT